MQNYRAINFSDIQVQGLSIVVDPNIQDERGANLDLGVRGDLNGSVQYDISGRLLLPRPHWCLQHCHSRPHFAQRGIRYRTNISDARILGVEGLIQGTIRLWEDPDAPHLHWFINGAFTEGKYLTSEESAFSGNQVELVPAVTSKVARHRTRAHLQHQYTYLEQFTDHQRPAHPGAVDGLVPAYAVLDFGPNGCAAGPPSRRTSTMLTPYFTRRAAGYPGPVSSPPMDGHFSGVGIQV